MKNFILELKNFVDDERGVTAIEYGLIASLIAVVMVTAVGELGQSIKDVFTAIAAAFV